PGPDRGHRRADRGAADLGDDLHRHVHARLDPAHRGQHAVPVDLRQQRRGLDGAVQVPGVLPGGRNRGAGTASRREPQLNRADGRRVGGDRGRARRLYRAVSPGTRADARVHHPVLHRDRATSDPDAGDLVCRAGGVRGRRADQSDRRRRGRGVLRPRGRVRVRGAGDPGAGHTTQAGPPRAAGALASGRPRNYARGRTLMRGPILALALVFIAILAALTVLDVVHNGFNGLDVVATAILGLFAVGIVGALRNPPPQ